MNMETEQATDKISAWVVNLLDENSPWVAGSPDLSVTSPFADPAGVTRVDIAGGFEQRLTGWRIGSLGGDPRDVAGEIVEAIGRR